MDSRGSPRDSELSSAFQSSTFDRDVQIRVNENVGSASISPSGRDVVLASREGLHIIDLDSPFSPPRYVPHRSRWEVADVQWSPFSSRDSWIVSTSNQKALVWNLNLKSHQAPIEHTLHAHSNAITDINFSAHHPDILATCAVDSYIHCWDLRRPSRPVISFAEWFSGATQVKWNRQDSHIIASSHQRKLMIWDDRKGAYPLREIEAHATQIYGIDWNRLRPEALLTCSLDRTIKFWDYTRSDDTPERVIRTKYPVWRARHTSFGWGVLAMPKRHDNNLYMYDSRLDAADGKSQSIDPVCTFEGHTDQVKEFLWRSRGGVDDGRDHREFQLVSWGMDKCLRLHRMSAEQLESVGHRRGSEVHEKLNLTRAGAVYRTFRDEKQLFSIPSMSNQLRLSRPPGLLGISISQGGMGKSASLNNLSSIAPVGMQARKRQKRTENTIDWMGGVKMGKEAVSGLPRNSIHPSDHQVVWDTPDSLSDEITYVGKKYKKVNFELVDINRRTATVTLNWPWGVEKKSAFIRVTFKFPSSYPVNAVPILYFEKTTSAISDTSSRLLKHSLQSIAEPYVLRRCGCLEAMIIYLLGERNFEDSLVSLQGANSIGVDDSSSDDDVNGQDLEMSGADLRAAHVNASVPLPKACGTMWSEDGRLICFFPPKPEPKPLFDLSAIRAGDRPARANRIFEEFGIWHDDSPEPRDGTSDEEVADDDEDSSEFSLSSSASSSSNSLQDMLARPGRFIPPASWQGATLRPPKGSQRSSTGVAYDSTTTKPKSYISIYDARDLLPAKKSLAEEYHIFGDGPAVCAHNAAVAAKFGFFDIAQVWELIRLILFNQVPLEILPQTYRKEPILVVARRALARMKKKDSAIDLATDSIDGPPLTGRVKWGGHPMAGKWLIPKLFEHFEKLADTQMLAMMSCVFSEPAARQPVANSLMRLSQKDLPMPMKSPAFSLDYFPSEEVAWSFFQNRATSKFKSIIPNPPRNSVENPETFGSSGSSNGPWTSDAPIQSESVAPYSTNSTPPKNSLSNALRSQYSHSYSTSPDHVYLRRTSTNPFLGFAGFYKPFAISGLSSPGYSRFRDGEADLSTSAPTSGVTWGETTVFKSSDTTGSTNSVAHRGNRQLRRTMFDGTIDMLGPSESEDDSSASSDDEELDSRRPSRPQSIVERPREDTAVKIKVTFKNQNQFDDEAHPSVPLLDPADAAKHAAYRSVYAEQLSIWQLPIARSEILKYNGLPSYWPEKLPQKNPEDSGKSSTPGPKQENETLAFPKGRPSKQQAPYKCRICWQHVVGLHVPCGICGVGRAHKQCVEAWNEEVGDEESWCDSGHHDARGNSKYKRPW